jgi:hypothetical protein
VAGEHTEAAAVMPISSIEPLSSKHPKNQRQLGLMVNLMFCAMFIDAFL